MNEQENSGNDGVHSKFQERLRNIRIIRSRKKGKNEQFVVDKVKEIRGKIQKEPGAVRVVKIPKGIDGNKKKGTIHVVDDKQVVSKVIVDIRKTAADRDYQRVKGGVDPTVKVIPKNRKLDKVGIVKEPKKVSKSGEVSSSDFVKGSAIREVELETGDLGKNWVKTSGIEVKKDVPLKDPRQPRKRYGYVDRGESLKEKLAVQDPITQKGLLREQGIRIIDRIKSSFEDKLDELVVLESELFLLEQDRENAIELKQVKEIKKRIDELIDRVNAIIEQYNLYKKNYYIDNLVGIDDGVLLDDIIDYRTLIDGFDAERKFVKEYKMLDEFRSLYSNLVQVKKDTKNLIEKNEQKINEFDVRDKKYDDIRLQMVQVDKVNKDCSLEMDRQNEYFSELMSKINHISREEYTTYHMRGIGELIGQSLRYMGLMLASPLAGFIPGIAINTLATRRMIGNIYQNMRMEPVHHVRYEAIDYDSEISRKLTDINYTSVLIDDTLKDIGRLKEDFMDQYDSRIPGYEDTLKKIDKMEQQIYRNQNRVEIVRKNLKASKKINANKLMRVRRLNGG